MIETRIAGIPCLIEPTSVFVQKPLGPMCDSDYDCYGYAEIEFDVLDRNGRPAPWLEKKLTPADIDRIETLILEQTEEV
jgi:hypothetical protein